MAAPNQERVVVPENLRKQLAIAVRSIQWSYAIFWSLSSTQQGELEWRDGYYNGDIRTRKTVQSGEVNADKLSLQRSQQLRELYESLKEGESDLGTNKRPSAALSPDDLTDLEWYYMVCMSYTFKFGQVDCLPRRALVSGQSIWLCNAQNADSKVFCRSLLAKSASIQTVICFPHMGGVIELGTNDKVEEDPNLIQHIKTCLLEIAKPACSEKSSSEQHSKDYDEDQIGVNVMTKHHEIVDATMDFSTLCPDTEKIGFDYEMVNGLHKSISEEFNICSPDDCSNDCCGNNHQADDSVMMDEENNVTAASPVRSWYFVDDDVSQCIHDSINSTGCISQAFANNEKTVEKINSQSVQELQDCNDTKFSSLDLGGDADDEDLHFKRTLLVILNSSPRTFKGTHTHCRSSFAAWKPEGRTDDYRPPSPQKTLKKALLIMPCMRDKTPQETLKDVGKDCPSQAAEKTKENEHYLAIRSILPSISKIDKTCILNDTIEYLKELATRVEELESCINLAESDQKIRRRYSDVMERTSDNYETKRHDDSKKKPWGVNINKRKACDIDETEPEPCKVIPEDNNPSLDMKVSIREHEVEIDMRCPWREYLLLDIMDAINNLNLDTHTVQSSTLDGILSVTLTSKFRGAEFASARMIKQALRRTIGIC
ncbi:hypothetical protein Dimus_006536 [Dionaea muscipula]